MYEHTERLLNASARWLHEATAETMSSDMRIAFAFLAGYNALQSVQAPYPGPLDHHPLASIVTEGATLLGLSEGDLKLGLALRQWEDWDRYHFEPPPVSVSGAAEWARRVRDAALARTRE
jgi:hypothetical protein